MRRWRVIALAAVALWAAPVAAQTAPSGSDWLRAIGEAPLAPKHAPRGADVTLVEFFDYACGYCRAFHPTLQAAIARDPRLRVVYRDWPVLGPASLTAARAALAAQWQGRHAAFHAALLESRARLSEETIRAAAQRAHVDWVRLQRDQQKHAREIDALLGETMQIANRLGLQGTPSLLIGRHLAAGALSPERLGELIAAARADRVAAGASAAR